jgi:hypothetical protein
MLVDSLTAGGALGLTIVAVASLLRPCSAASSSCGPWGRGRELQVSNS